MKSDELNKLRIPKSQRTGKGIPAVIIYATVVLALAVGVYLAWPRASDSQRVVNSTKPYVDPKAATPRPASAVPAATPPPADGEVVLTTSGYIINRERIELSPRFVGVVKWIGLKKGDPVKRDQVVVLLEDSEQKARLFEAEGRQARAQAALAIANTRYKRLLKLREQRVESEQLLDDAQAEMQGATAGMSEAQGFSISRNPSWNGPSSARRSTVWCLRSSPTKTNSCRRRVSAEIAAQARRCSPWRTRRIFRSRSISMRATSQRSFLGKSAGYLPRHIPTVFTADMSRKSHRGEPPKGARFR